VISRLIVENLGPIERVEVPLARFTVLVGKNDAGKSTILRALQALDDIVRPDPAGRKVRVPRWTFSTVVRDHDVRRAIRITAIGDADGTRFEYAITFDDNAGVSDETLTWAGGQIPLSRDGNISISGQGHRIADWWRIEGPLLRRARDLVDYPMFVSVADELRWLSLRLNPERLAAPCGLDVDGETLASDGFGLAAVIDQILTGTDDTARESLERDLRRFTPFVRKIGTRRASNATGKEIIVSLTNGTTVSLAELSDGLRLAIGFFVLRHLRDRHLLVEEPENGVHPRRMREIAEVLRRAALMSGGQVVATTHSPLFLNHVEPEEAVVVTRDARGVHATPMLETKWFKERADGFGLGELWYNVGEEELVPEAS
jgi:predicted ATPase